MSIAFELALSAELTVERFPASSLLGFVVLWRGGFLALDRTAKFVRILSRSLSAWGGQTGVGWLLLCEVVGGALNGRRRGLCRRSRRKIRVRHSILRKKICQVLSKIPQGISSQRATKAVVASEIAEEKVGFVGKVGVRHADSRHSHSRCVVWLVKLR